MDNRPRFHTRDVLSLGVVFAAVVLYLFASESDYQDEQRDLRHYCAMLALYDETDGRHGWPDYDKKGDQCNESNSAVSRRD